MDKLLLYANWLRAEGYQESTIKVTLRHLKTAALLKVVSPYRVAHVQRYLRYVAETRKNPLGSEFLKLAMRAGYEASADRKRSGARVKEPLSEAAWARLKAKLRRGDETSWMLVAYMQSAYRIGGFLKLLASKVDETDIDDKISLDWIRDREKTVRVNAGVEMRKLPLFKLLCKTERCAYYRMRSRLLDVCEKMGLEADFDTLYKTRNERTRAESAA